MDETDELRMKRTLLERQLVMLEREMDAQRQHGASAPELAERMTALFAELRPVNERLAMRHGPAAPAE